MLLVIFFDYIEGIVEDVLVGIDCYFDVEIIGIVCSIVVELSLVVDVVVVGGWMSDWFWCLMDGIIV